MTIIPKPEAMPAVISSPNKAKACLLCESEETNRPAVSLNIQIQGWLQYKGGHVITLEQKFGTKRSKGCSCYWQFNWHWI